MVGVLRPRAVFGPGESIDWMKVKPVVLRDENRKIRARFRATTLSFKDHSVLEMLEQEFDIHF